MGNPDISIESAQCCRTSPMCSRNDRAILGYQWRDDDHTWMAISGNFLKIALADSSSLVAVSGDFERIGIRIKSRRAQVSRISKGAGAAVFGELPLGSKLSYPLSAMLVVEVQERNANSYSMARPVAFSSAHFSLSTNHRANVWESRRLDSECEATRNQTSEPGQADVHYQWIISQFGKSPDLVSVLSETRSSMSWCRASSNAAGPVLPRPVWQIAHKTRQVSRYTGQN